MFIWEVQTSSPDSRDLELRAKLHLRMPYNSLVCISVLLLIPWQWNSSLACKRRLTFRYILMSAFYNIKCHSSGQISVASQICFGIKMVHSLMFIFTKLANGTRSYLKSPYTILFFFFWQTQLLANVTTISPSQVFLRTSYNVGYLTKWLVKW